MDKAVLLKRMNIFMLTAFVFQIASGFAHSLLGRYFLVIHFCLAMLLAFLVALHIYLNWTWVKSVFLKKTGRT